MIDDFDVEGRVCIVRPFEADSPLRVDSDAELAPSISPERFKTVAWQQHKTVPTDRVEQNTKSFLRLLLERLELPDTFTIGEASGTSIHHDPWINFAICDA
jgi:uncharacterized UBP type Zn finger protein